MNSSSLADLSLAAFDRVVQGTDGFRARPGQRQMAQCIANALADVTLGEHADPRCAVAVIQAGTGVGKSAAYLATTVALALARKTRVLISTATVALQEQLMHKDLPALAAVSEGPFVFALAKGRGRYVCKLKLERHLGGLDGADLFEGDDDALAPRPPFAKPTQGEDPEARRQHLYAALAKSLTSGTWDGDRDQLAEQPEPRDWSFVAAERHTCTARHCPKYQQCSYYQARTRLAQAQVIVANHDLVLASLGMKALPELDNCLVVFDEGHHLPAVALDQFSSSMELSGLRWLDKLPKALQEVGEALQFALAQDVSTLSGQLKTALFDMGRMVMDLMALASTGYDSIHRLKDGVLPPAFFEPLTLILGHAKGLLHVLEALGAEVKLLAKEDPTQAASSALRYAKLGQFAPKLVAVVDTASLLLAHDPQPLAKWFASDTSSGLVALTAHACPLVPGDLLRQRLWSQARGVVITSASLTSCASFDYFLQEAGLTDLPHVATLEVPSPFNYSTQGRLLVVETQADPKDAPAYTREMVHELLQDLAKMERGALVLFTSRMQMQAAVDALPPALRSTVLVQGQLARNRLLAAHQARIEAGQASVIFGMQSFGEGLDLPGRLCETVFIAKLPFSPPSDPVAQARAEWLRSLGQDSFSELVVPATGIRLLQWTGRAIRSEHDHACVICYDRRLLRMPYGRRMLAGLPPYALSRRVGGVTVAVPNFGQTSQNPAPARGD